MPRNLTIFATIAVSAVLGACSPQAREATQNAGNAISNDIDNSIDNAAAATAQFGRNVGNAFDNAANSTGAQVEKLDHRLK